MSSTTMRVFDFTKEAVDKFLEKVNAKRKKQGLHLLNKTEVLAIAVKNLKEEDGLK